MTKDEESAFAVMREALAHALLSHSNRGRAQPCDCSLCTMIRLAMKPEAGKLFADRVRMECIQVVDYKRGELQKNPELAEKTKAVHVAREISEMLRCQLWSPGPEKTFG
jgi:formate dehydrogenase assembly factor FdhD